MLCEIAERFYINLPTMISVGAELFDNLHLQGNKSVRVFTLHLAVSVMFHFVAAVDTALDPPTPPIHTLRGF